MRRMRVENLKRIIVESMKDSRLGSLFRLTCSGDRDAWMVFLDALEEENPAARQLMDRYSTNVVQKLVVLRDAMPQGVIKNDKIFERTVGYASGLTGLSFKNPLGITAVGDDHDVIAKDDPADQRFIQLGDEIIAFNDDFVNVWNKNPPDELTTAPVQAVSMNRDGITVQYVGGPGVVQLDPPDEDEEDLVMLRNDLYKMYQRQANAAKRRAEAAWVKLEELFKMP